MKKLVLIAFVSLLAITGYAQMEIPQPSPAATVKQMVGLTEITIEYSSPGVKGREIFGDLVPYDKVWRTGANAPTKITFSKDVTINNKPVPAGTYAFFTIPGKKDWTIILNKNHKQWGAGDYSEDEDVLRIKAMPAKVAPRERLSFQIIDFDNEKATIVLEWARTRVAFIVTVNTNEQALKSIEKVLNPSSGSYAQGARFALEQMGDVEKAQDWAQKSIDLEETWYNNWIMGNILAKKNNYTDALTYMQKALELGNQNPERFFYKDKVEKAIEEWKGK
jgi:Protein of unknown function (DUF2911)